MSTPRPTEADMEVLVKVIDEATAYTQPGRGLITLNTARAEAVLASDWLAARDAEHQRDRDALRLAMRALTSACDVLLKASGLPDDTDDIDLINETVLGLAFRAETAGRDRDEARRELADLRAKVAALANEWERSTRGIEEPDDWYGAHVRALLLTEDDQ